MMIERERERERERYCVLLCSLNRLSYVLDMFEDTCFNAKGEEGVGGT
jgi:hypothetical protein